MSELNNFSLIDSRARIGLGMGGMGGRPGGGDDEQEEVVEVPNAMVGMLIGRGGENIQSIQRNSSCHVQVETLCMMCE